jgi:aryl-alcohol dehydrogenase-like predicted oxidoreductase
MKYGKITGVSKPVSKIIFGCTSAMNRGENVDELLDSAYQHGITAFDTAEHYGLAEVSIGEWMQRRNNREKVVIITKGCHPTDRDRVTPEDLQRDIEQSFKRLKTDYIDIYLLHRDDLKTTPDKIVDILNKYYKDGKIRAFGGSNWTHKRIDEANKYAAGHNLASFTVSSPNFSLCEMVRDPWGGGAGCVTISGQKNLEARKWYQEHNMPVLAYSPLGRGMFTGRVKSSNPEDAKNILDPSTIKGFYSEDNIKRLARAEKLAGEKGCSVSQITLSWIISQPIDAYPIVSMSSAERIASSVKSCDIALTQEELEWLEKGE